MTEVKDVIGILCKLFSSYGFTRLYPETFRRAKFNEDNAENFWLVLGELVSINHSKKWHLSKCLKNTIHRTKREDLMSFVKMELASEGFLLPTFHSITTVSENSRELLIALGWYLVHTSALDNLVKTRIHQAEMIWQDFISPPEYKMQMNADCLNKFSTKNMKEKTDRLLWLFGRIHFAIRNLKLVNQEKLSLLSQIQSGLTSKKILSKRNSVQSIFMKNTKFVDMMNSFLEQEIKILNLHIQWSQKEKIFWKWMQSVLKMRQEDLNIEISVKNHSLLNSVSDYCFYQMKYFDDVSMIKKFLHNCDESLNELNVIPFNVSNAEIKLSTLNIEIKKLDDDFKKELQEITSCIRIELDKISNLMDVICIKPPTNNIVASAAF